MGRIKNILAYTNPFAYAFGIPYLVGMFLSVFGYRVGKDVKKATEMVVKDIERD